MRVVITAICALVVSGSATLPAAVQRDDGSTISFIRHTGNIDIQRKMSEAQAAAGNNEFKQIRHNIIDKVDDILVADFNNDGYSDVAILDKEAKRIRVFLGNKDMKFGKGLKRKFAEVGEIFAGAADFSGDKKLDIAIDNSSNSRHFSIFPGKGNGRFGKPKSIPETGTALWGFDYAAACDLNGDGKPDLIGLKFGGDIAACLNKGKLNFEVHKRDESFSEGLAVGDFNGDKKDDFFVGNSFGEEVTFFKSDGDGTFTKGAKANVGSQGEEVYAGYINKDNKLDLFGDGSGFSGSPWAMIGKGDGRLIKKKTLPGDATMHYGAVISDFTGDGKTDIASAEVNGIYLYGGKGTGKFKHTDTLGSGLRFNTNGFSDGANNIGRGDFNKDGNEDIVGAQRYTTGDGSQNLVFFLSGQKSATLEISNLEVTELTFDTDKINVTLSFDFTGTDIDIRWNKKGKHPTESAFLKFMVTIDLPFPIGDVYITYYVTGEFLDKPGESSGTIYFSRELPSSVKITGTGPAPDVTLSNFYLFDMNLFSSNRLK